MAEICKTGVIAGNDEQYNGAFSSGPCGFQDRPRMNSRCRERWNLGFSPGRDGEEVSWRRELWSITTSENSNPPSRRACVVLTPTNGLARLNTAAYGIQAVLRGLVVEGEIPCRLMYESRSWMAHGLSEIIRPGIRAHMIAGAVPSGDPDISV